MIDDNSETILISWLTSNEDIHRQKQRLHIFGENVRILTHNGKILSELDNLPEEMHAVDSIPTNCGFTESEKNFQHSENGGLIICLKCKIGTNLMLTTNIDVQDRLINRQFVIKIHFKFVENKI